VYHPAMQRRSDVISRLEVALTTLTRGATKRRRHRARLDSAGVELTLPGYWLLAECVAHGSITVTALAESLDMAVPQVSRELRSLVETGMVSRTVAAHDSRVVIIMPTPAGRKAFTRLRRASEEQIEAVVADWDAQSIATLADLLERFAKSVQRIQSAADR